MNMATIGLKKLATVSFNDLFLDVLPTGYKLKTQRNDKGELVREVEFE